MSASQTHATSAATATNDSQSNDDMEYFANTSSSTNKRKSVVENDTKPSATVVTPTAPSSSSFVFGESSFNNNNIFSTTTTTTTTTTASDEPPKFTFQFGPPPERPPLTSVPFRFESTTTTTTPSVTSTMASTTDGLEGNSRPAFASTSDGMASSMTNNDTLTFCIGSDTTSLSRERSMSLRARGRKTRRIQPAPLSNAWNTSSDTFATTAASSSNTGWVYETPPGLVLGTTSNVVTTTSDGSDDEDDEDDFEEDDEEDDEDLYAEEDYEDMSCFEEESFCDAVIESVFDHFVDTVLREYEDDEDEDEDVEDCHDHDDDDDSSVDDSDDETSSEQSPPRQTTCAICFSKSRNLVTLPCCGTKAEAESSTRFCQKCTNRCLSASPKSKVFRDGTSATYVGECPRCRKLLSFSMQSLSGSSNYKIRSQIKVAATSHLIQYLEDKNVVGMSMEEPMVMSAYAHEGYIPLEVLGDDMDKIRRLVQWGLLNTIEEGNVYSIPANVQTELRNRVEACCHRYAPVVNITDSNGDVVRSSDNDTAPSVDDPTKLRLLAASTYLECASTALWKWKFVKATRLTNRSIFLLLRYFEYLQPSLDFWWQRFLVNALNIFLASFAFFIFFIVFVALLLSGLTVCCVDKMLRIRISGTRIGICVVACFVGKYLYTIGLFDYHLD